MNVIVCLDNAGGMLFNHRRQSRDRIMNEKILDIAGEGRLLINDFSSDLFSDAIVDELFLENAKADDFCFVEDQTLNTVKEMIDTLYIFKWNRDYPGDFYFDLDLNEYQCINTEEFAGSSHEKITLEIWRKK